MLVGKLLNYVYIYTISDFSLQKNLNHPGKILVFVMILIVFFVVIVATKIFRLSCCRNKILKDKNTKSSRYTVCFLSPLDWREFRNRTAIWEKSKWNF